MAASVAKPFCMNGHQHLHQHTTLKRACARRCGMRPGGAGGSVASAGCGHGRDNTPLSSAPAHAGLGCGLEVQEAASPALAAAMAAGAMLFLAAAPLSRSRAFRVGTGGVTFMLLSLLILAFAVSRCASPQCAVSAAMSCPQHLASCYWWNLSCDVSKGPSGGRGWGCYGEIPAPLYR